MNSSTAMIAAQYRLKEWAEQIKACNSRPHGMTVDDWCADYGITKANYYYRLKRVRATYLESSANNDPEAAIIPLPLKIPGQDPKSSSALAISANGFSVQVDESTSMDLLSNVLKVVANAQ